MNEIDDNILDKSIECIHDICKEYSEEYERVKKEYGLNEKIGFNIFSTISDKYYYENLHSDILARILDPNAEETGNSKFLEYFLEFIECETDMFKDMKKVVCKREEDRIDIFIHDDEKAIIIENKINYAIDQKRQLYSYMEEAEKDGLEVVKIIYLTLKDDKTVDFSTYTEIERKAVEEKLVPKVAVSKKDKKDLVHYFLPKCIDYIDNDLTQKENIDFYVFLKHYRKLLMHLGGNEIMEKHQKDLVRKLYSSKENILAIENLRELLSDGKLVEFYRNKIVAEKIKDNNENMYFDCSEYRNTIYKKIDEDENVGIAYYYDIDNTEDFGCYAFISLNKKGSFKSDLKSILLSILNDDSFKSYSYDVDEIKDVFYWIYRDLKIPNSEKFTIDEIYTLIMGKLQLMEDLYIEMKKQ